MTGEERTGPDREDRLLALLFVSGEPVGYESLCRWLEVDRDTLATLIEDAARRLGNLPWRLRMAAGGVRLVLGPESVDFVRSVQGERGPETLSHALWECLAVVAYSQPLTRLEVEEARQVHSEYALESLIRRGLIEEVGRKETPGRPILYGTTRRFLEVFGLDSLEDLPPRPVVEAQTPAGETT